MYKCKRTLTLFKSAVFLLVIGIIGGIFFVRGYVSSSIERVREQDYEIKVLKGERDFFQGRVAFFKDQIKSLVAGTIPDLNELLFDQVIEVNQNYVKNLVFSVSKKSDETRYEYQIVLHNQTPIVVQPRIKVLLFDRTGLQIGISDLKGIKDNVLIPGETRSLHAVFDISLENREPTYFLLMVQ
ncbi:MAG: hypothetical protein H6981_14595 [Gammaproteobacteria bacterium]|nr:hypothetical protein [Gammaproteobacteria bacterium]MCP5138013.1 hypothetical protein [Gammaproteobacteria bacterium]